MTKQKNGQPVFCKVWKATQLKNGLSALSYCIETKCDADNAFIIPQIGFVSLKYGTIGDPSNHYKKGSGISHIIAKRDDEEANSGVKTVKKLIDVLVNGKINKVVEAKQTIHIEKDGYEAIVSLNWCGTQITWLLTGFKIIK